MEYQNIICDYCNLCAGLIVKHKKGVSLGSDYAEGYVICRSTDNNKSALRQFIAEKNAKRYDKPIADYVEEGSVPPNIWEYYIWIEGGMIDEAQRIIRNCQEEFPKSGSGCLPNYILNALAKRDIEYMVEEIAYGDKGDENYKSDLLKYFTAA